MNKFKLELSIIIIFLSINSFSQTIQEISQVYAKLAGINSITLSKTASPSLTTYSNINFNVKYTAPDGWSFDTPFEGTTGVFWMISNTLYPSVGIICAAYKRTDPDAAAWFGPNTCFENATVCFRNQITQVAYLFSCSDTTYTNTGNHFANQEIKYLDDHSKITGNFTVQNGVYIQTFFYSTTVSDYNLNFNEYIKNWINMTWYSSTSVSKEMSLENTLNYLSIQKNQAILIFNQSQHARLDAFTLQGKNAKTLFNEQAKGNINISLEGLNPSQNYILRLQTDKNNSTKKILKLK